MHPEPVPSSAAENGLPEILLDTDEHRAADEAIEALAADPGMYVRGGRLVRICFGDNHPTRQRTALIARMSTSTIRERLTRYACFLQRGRDGTTKPCHPSGWLVSAVADRGEWAGLRALTGLAFAPVLRRDGTVCQQPCYDPSTGVYLHLAEAFPAVPDRPSREDAVHAVAQLVDIVRDFPFAGPEHRSAYLAALLTALARHAIDGPTPLFLFDANMRGAGKSKLCQVIAMVVSGEDLPVACCPSQDDELRKRISAAAQSGDQFIVLDNIAGPLGSASLDAALTTTRWRDRRLGESTLIDVPLLAIWLATGNNVQLVADTSRRVVPVRLESQVDRPEERGGFKYPDLMGHVRANRGQLLCAALTVLRAFAVADWPRAGLKPFGSFEAWSMIRDLLVWVGQPDPVLTRQNLMVHADETEELLERLHECIKAYDASGEGFVVGRALRELYPVEGPAPDNPVSAALRSVLEDLAGGPAGRQPTSRVIGNRLKGLRRRPLKGQMLDTSRSRGRDGSVWKVVPSVTLRNCDSAGSSDPDVPGVSTGGGGTDS